MLDQFGNEINKVSPREIQLAEATKLKDLSNPVQTEHVDKNDDDFLVMKRSQEVGSILEDNKQQFNSAPQSSHGQTMRKAAQIPAVVMEMWFNEGINVFAPNDEDIARMKKKLNSSEWAFLRTAPGRL